MHQWCPLYWDFTVASQKIHWVQPKILVAVINFCYIKIEVERVSSSQNERTLWRGGGLLKNEQGGWEGSKLGNLEQTYFLHVPKWNLTPKDFQGVFRSDIKSHLKIWCFLFCEIYFWDFAIASKSTRSEHWGDS